jgi:hypothetical protein
MKKIIFFLTAMLLIMSAALAQKTLVSSSGRTSDLKLNQGVSLANGNERMASHPSRGAQPLWQEDFDGSFPPTGWTLYQSNAALPFLYYTSYGRTTPACFGYDGGLSSYPIRGITTHAFTPVAGAVFSFWAMHDVAYTPGSSWYTAYRIKVSTTTNAQASFTTIKEYANYAYAGINSNRVIFTPQQISDWYNMTLDLSAYVGQQIYVAIEVYDHYGDDGITIDDVGVVVLRDNDLTLQADGFPYTKIPQDQAALLPFPNMTAKAYNAGKLAQTNVKTYITHNATPIGTSNNIANLASGATSATMTVTPIAGTAFPTTLGTNNVLYEVRGDQIDDDPSDNSKTFAYDITTNLYAQDDVGPTQLAGYGVGVGAADAIMGQIYRITSPTMLNQVVVGFGEGSGQTENVNLRIYGMSGATTLSSTTPLMNQLFQRKGGWSTVTVPSTLLMPGNYFLCVQEISAINCGMAYDGIPGKVCYYNSAGTTALTSAAGFGCVAIRMVTAPLPNIDLQAVSVTGNTTPMATIPENYIVTVKNVGSQPASNFTVRLETEAGDLLDTQTVAGPLVTGATSTAIFPITFPQAWAGPLKIKGVVAITGDENPANNESPLLTLNIQPNPGYVTECNTNGIDIQVGTGANNYTIPVNNYYNRSYTQQIYDAAEINKPAGTQIGNISFQLMGGGTYTKTAQTIYLANTTKSTFTGTTDYIPASELQLVFTGSITFSQTLGWNTGKSMLL